MAASYRILNCRRVNILHLIKKSDSQKSFVTYAKYNPLMIQPVCGHIKQPFTLGCVKYTMQQSAHDHSRLWTAERILSASMLGLVPLAFIYPSPALDYALALVLTTHMHWGVEAVAVDYVRPNLGPTFAKIAGAGVYFISILTLGGLFYFNYNDVGLVQAIKMLWKL